MLLFVGVFILNGCFEIVPDPTYTQSLTEEMFYEKEDLGSEAMIIKHKTVFKSKTPITAYMVKVKGEWQLSLRFIKYNLKTMDIKRIVLRDKYDKLEFINFERVKKENRRGNV